MAEYVLLGVADELIKSRKTSWNCNKIGGIADWMNEHNGLPLCFQCNQPQNLVIQIYCPLDNSKYHRSLYVFCCLKKECWISCNGWSVYRMQCRQTKHSPSNSEEKSSVFSTWDCDDDDWGNTENAINENSLITLNALAENNSSSSADIVVVENKLQSIHLKNDSKMEFIVCKTEPNQASFNSYFINVFNEADCAASSDNDKHVQDLLQKYKDSNHDSEMGLCTQFQPNSEEKYEKCSFSDRLLSKFYKKVNIFPTQVIRYSRYGSPVLFTEKPNEMSIPKCRLCGAKRVFEFQLMPALIPYLLLDDKECEYVEFGSVLVYTCSKSCWDNKPQKEFCLYFADPDLKHFR